MYEISHYHELSAHLSDMSTRDLQLRTIELLEKIARSQRVLERRVDAMEKMVLSYPPPPSSQEETSSFPQFRRLPPEIRHRIWELAIPVRALRLRRGRGGFIPTLRPPAVAETCREGRAVATAHGGGMVSVTGCGKGEEERRCWSWFDGRRDVLELERWVSLERDEPRSVRELVSRARHVLAPRADATWFKRLFEEAVELRRVSLKFDTTVASRCAWDANVVRDVFGSVDTVAILDLEDAEEIGRFKGALGEHWRCPFFCEFDIEGWAREKKTATAVGEKGEKWMRELEGSWMSEVARGLVMAKTKMGPNDGIDVEDEDVRRALSCMPDVRLVRAYLLADVHGSR
ncbi:hypothetical protein CcaCcLH18_06915 [Colletotrichum camelliae]|nr:hypothetical protein CcaCcLH18_06915 [Colletotrichum camelliae]